VLHFVQPTVAGRLSALGETICRCTVRGISAGTASGGKAKLDIGESLDGALAVGRQAYARGGRAYSTYNGSSRNAAGGLCRCSLGVYFGPVLERAGRKLFARRGDLDADQAITRANAPSRSFDECASPIQLASDACRGPGFSISQHVVLAIPPFLSIWFRKSLLR
jgi:hypothetical protein